MKISKEALLIASLVTLKVLVHLLVMHRYGLQRDAYLYYALGENLDWGFVSVPPFIGLLSKVMTGLFGNTIFALRILPALTGGLSVYLIAKIVKELRGGITAILLAGLAFILSPAFLRSNLLFQPVSFNQFAWLLSAYLLIRMINRNEPRGWIWIMLTWSLAFLNKYSVAFYILGALLSLLVTPHRRFLASKYFLISAAIAILIILPNLLWQYQHNWPIASHMAELRETQLVHVSLPGFIIDQFVAHLPAVILWISGLVLVLLKKEYSRYRFLAWLYLLTTLLLILSRGKSYYTYGLYSMLFALGGVMAERYFRRRMHLALVAIMILTFLPLAPISLPMLSYKNLERYTRLIAPFVNRWENGEIYSIPQDFADMTGWEELSGIVINTYRSLDPEQQHQCMICAENYGQAGCINFHGKEHGLPEVVSFDDNFILWAPDSARNGPMIYVNHSVGDIDRLYHSVKYVDRVEDPYFRENGVKVYLCQEPTAILPSFYAKKVRQMRNLYTRQKN